MGRSFEGETEAAFREFVLQEDFPCLGARAAFNGGSYMLRGYDELAGIASSEALAADLRQFARSELRGHEYASFVAIFRAPDDLDEVRFEDLLWRQLAMLNRADATESEWDPAVSSDPADPMFSFSFAEQALYVVGLHPKSSRMARRFR